MESQNHKHDSKSNGLKMFFKRFFILLFALTLLKAVSMLLIQFLRVKDPFLEAGIEIGILVLVLTPLLLLTYGGKEWKRSETLTKLLLSTDIFEFANDIIHYKKTKHDLSMARKEQKNILRQQQGMIFVVKKINHRYIHTLCDGELMYRMGAKPEMVVGKELIDFLPRDQVMVKLQYYQRAWEGQEVSYEGEVNGIHYLASLRPIHENGKVIQLIGSAIDITELKKTEELLRKTEKLSVIGELAAGVAHEIRNPLTTLKGFLQLHQNHHHLDPVYIDIMMSELDRINSIVGEFLVLSKPQVVHFDPKNIATIVQDTSRLLESQALMNRIEMKTDIPSHLPLVMCDQNQLKQVFMNIIKNAIESMPNGGELHIQVKLIDNLQVSVSILDQGCGIPQERIDRLGEPFYTTKEKGTGLGLMVTRKIIENHQGKMVIRSEVGKGTCVEVLFPVILSQEQSTVDEIVPC